MAESKDSQAQQISVFWLKMVDDQMARVSAFCEQIQTMQAEGARSAVSAIDEMARLGKDSFETAARLSGEVQRSSLEATRRALEFAQRGFQS